MIRAIPIRTETLLALVALCAVVFSALSREARRSRGWIGPGDLVTVAVLEALPGHPIDGDQLVAPDGTIDLGSPYGRLEVEGLTYPQVKVRVVGRLGRFLDDETLGLIVPAQAQGSGPNVSERVPPGETDRVFVYAESGDVGPYSTDLSILETLNHLLGYAPAPVLGGGCGVRCAPPKPPRFPAIERLKTYSYRIFVGPQMLLWIFLLGKGIVAFRKWLTPYQR